MRKQEFIERLKKIMEIEHKVIDETTYLLDIEEYDSLAALAIIALIDQEFGKPVTQNDFLQFTSIQSIIHFVGPDRFEP